VAGRSYRWAVQTPTGIANVEATMPEPGDPVDGYASREVRVTGPR